MQPRELSPKDPARLQTARDRLSRSSIQQGMARLRKALCDPARLEIVQALATGEISVNDLALAIDRQPAATSQHLRVLRELGLVEARRQGTTMYYHLEDNAAARQLETVLATLSRLPEEWTA